MVPLSSLVEGEKETMQLDARNKVIHTIDLCHSAAMLSLRKIKSFVFAWL